jgi:hypothetical protein
MDLAFTFGIVTDGSPEGADRVRRILARIAAENIPAYEVVVVGTCPGLEQDSHLRVIPFDESQRPRWITRKKNLITRNARFDNIVYMHDYLLPEPGWYAGWQIFGSAFHACMNPILNADGERFRDWTLFYDASVQPAKDFAGAGRFDNLLPYSETGLSKGMYFSGAYWVAKRDIMREFPLDERLSWGEGEDVIWSHQFRERYIFSINTHSSVRIFGKKKDRYFSEIRPEVLAKMKDYWEVHPIPSGYGCSSEMEVWRAHEHWGPVKAIQAAIGGAR